MKPYKINKDTLNNLRKKIKIDTNIITNNVINIVKKAIIKLKDFFYVFSSTIITATITFIAGVVIRRNVDPTDYGLYMSIILVTVYLAYSQLGVLNASIRDIPYLRGRNNNEEADKVLNTSYTFVVAISTLIIFGSLLVGYISIKIFDVSFKISYGITLSGVISGLLLLVSFLDNWFRIEGWFKRYSFFYSFKVSISSFFAIIGSIKFGYYGIFFGEFIACIVIIVCNLKAMTRLKLYINYSIIKKLMLTGIPLMMTSAVWTLMISVDRVVIISVIDLKALGYYSIAIMTYSSVMLIPQSISTVLYPKMSNSFGAHNSKTILFGSALNYAVIMSIISGYVISITYLLLPTIVKYILPQYLQGIEASRILLYGVGVMSVLLSFTNLLTILHRHYIQLFALLAAVFLNFIFAYTLTVFVKKDISSVASGTALAYATYTFFMIAIVCKECGQNIKKTIIKAMLPIFIIVGPVIIINAIFDVNVIKYIVIVCYLLSSMIGICLFIYNKRLIDE